MRIQQVGAARAVAALLVVGAAACTLQERTDRDTGAASATSDSASSEFLRPWGDAEPPRGVRSGDLVWVWGMPGTLPGLTPPTLVPGGAGAEARQALANVRDVLASAGGALRDVAQCSLFVVDSADVGAANAAYVESFGVPPARTAVVPAGLALDARVEIECTAVLSSGMDGS